MSETNGHGAEQDPDQIQDDLLFLLAAIVHNAGGELRIPRSALSGDEVTFQMIDEPWDDAYVLKTHVVSEGDQ